MNDHKLQNKIDNLTDKELLFLADKLSHFNFGLSLKEWIAHEYRKGKTGVRELLDKTKAR
jgi:hypothetical protein